MAITIINQTTYTDNFSVLINGKKVDTLIPNETLLVALPEEPATLSFRWSRTKPVQVRHDDVIVLTDHKLNAFLRNKWIYFTSFVIWLTLVNLIRKFELYNDYETIFKNTPFLRIVLVLPSYPILWLSLGQRLTPSFMISKS